MTLIVPVILSGGSGSRLWPLSRQAYPKQFLPAPNSEQSFLQNTVNRVKSLNGFGHIIMSGNENHRFTILEQLEDVGVKNPTVLLEPMGRNTAPAMGLVAQWAKEHLPTDAQLLFLPSDHFIPDSAAFCDVIQTASTLAETHIVTFGITPTFAATGYGYIQAGAAIGAGFQVQKFVEKPDADTAQRYLEAGTFSWNGGIFLTTATTLLEALKTHAPTLAAPLATAAASLKQDAFFWRPHANAFAACPDVSIDYAVMEHTKNAVVVPFTGAWNDIGSFQALWEASEQDAAGNVTHGQTLLQNCTNCYVHAEADALVTATDLDGQVIIHTKDATLIVPAEKAQNVKDIYTQLKAAGDTRHITHTTDHRPWGGFENLAEGVEHTAKFKVKHLWVKAGGRLSLQSHTQRSEHWIVLEGTATVTQDDNILTLEAGASTFIPVGTKHRLENKGSDILHIIEVQTGTYFGEDDITRYDDVYGRK